MPIANKVILDLWSNARGNKGDYYCVDCTRFDFIFVQVYGDKVSCKIDDDEHREMRSAIDSSFCKDFRLSKKAGKKG